MPQGQAGQVVSQAAGRVGQENMQQNAAVQQLFGTLLQSAVQTRAQNIAINAELLRTNADRQLAEAQHMAELAFKERENARMRSFEASERSKDRVARERESGIMAGLQREELGLRREGMARDTEFQREKLGLEKERVGLEGERLDMVSDLWAAQSENLRVSADVNKRVSEMGSWADRTSAELQRNQLQYRRDELAWRQDHATQLLRQGERELGLKTIADGAKMAEAFSAISLNNARAEHERAKAALTNQNLTTGATKEALDALGRASDILHQEQQEIVGRIDTVRNQARAAAGINEEGQLVFDMGRSPEEVERDIARWETILTNHLDESFKDYGGYLAYLHALLEETHRERDAIRTDRQLLLEQITSEQSMGTPGVPRVATPPDIGYPPPRK